MIDRTRFAKILAMALLVAIAFLAAYVAGRNAAAYFAGEATDVPKHAPHHSTAEYASQAYYRGDESFLEEGDKKGRVCNHTYDDLPATGNYLNIVDGRQRWVQVVDFGANNGCTSEWFTTNKEGHDIRGFDYSRHPG